MRELTALLGDLSPAELIEVRRRAEATAERAADPRVQQVWRAFGDLTHGAWKEVRAQWTDAAVLIEELFDDCEAGEIRGERSDDD